MKKINLLMLILIVLSSYNSPAQNVNILTESEYSNILINDVNWNQIKETQGNLFELKTYFEITESSINAKTEPSLAKEIKIANFYFHFEDRSGVGNNYELTDFSIMNNQGSITVKGKMITIGDNINKLGLVLINTNSEGEKKIIFGTNYASDGIWISFNQSTKLITKIEYTLYD